MKLNNIIDFLEKEVKKCVEETAKQKKEYNNTEDLGRLLKLSQEMGFTAGKTKIMEQLVTICKE